MTKICVEDEAHAELCGEYPSIEIAMTDLKRWALIPWDQTPNRAPCSSWQTCGRKYEVVEYDDSQVPWKELHRTPVLNISAAGVEWPA